MHKLIYLASPYTSPFQDIIERRVRQVRDATAKFIEQGHLIFSPIINSHPIVDLVSFSALNAEGAMTPWMEYDKAMIDRSDEVWVLCLQGWELSRGVSEEVLHALNQGKTVRYFDYPRLREIGQVAMMTGSEFTQFLTLEEAADELLTRYGAGTFYSPQSTGQPPVKKFEDETHTTYAQADGYCPDSFGGDEYGMTREESYRIVDQIYAEDAKQIIVGLNGVAQSGKDTTGEHLIKNYGFVRVSFADAVRDALYALNPRIFNYSNELCNPPREDGRAWRLRDYVDRYGWELMKNRNSEVRELLQRMGTEAGRDIHGDTCWLEIAGRKIQAAYPAPVVITDIRFPNEAVFVRNLGGKVVHVTRPGVDALNGHASEQSLDFDIIDYCLVNNSTIPNLEGSIDSMMRELTK
jgi:hypothetical protein